MTNNIQTRVAIETGTVRADGERVPASRQPDGTVTYRVAIEHPKYGPNTLIITCSARQARTFRVA